YRRLSIWRTRHLERHHPSRFRNPGKVQDNRSWRGWLADYHRHRLCIDLLQHTDDSPLSVDRLFQLDADLSTHRPAIILESFQWPIKPRRGQFERVGMGKRVDDVQGWTQRHMRPFTITDGNPARFVDVDSHHRS